jgi:hypothetical protein
MSESADDRRDRRARAMFRACRPDRDWERADEQERRYWLAAAHAVEASDAEAGLQPMPIDRPFGAGRDVRSGDSGAGHRGLGAHSPALGAMYDLGGVEAAPDRAPDREPDREPGLEPARRGESAAPGGMADLGPQEEGPGLPTVVRALLAIGAFIAAAALLLAVGYYLATGSA